MTQPTTDAASIRPRVARRRPPREQPACPICGGSRVREMLDLLEAPLFCNALHGTAEEARQAPRGRLQLTLCLGCGVIWNAAFDPQRVAYTTDYENAQHFSPRFRAYLEQLATRLVLDYDLRRRQIVDVGCGDGLFLRLLCQQGHNEGLGFDPAAPVEGRLADCPNVSIRRQIFSAAELPTPPDLVACRHVLEHLPDPTTLLNDVRQTLGEASTGYAYFEVPNTWTALRDLGVWEFLYEHVFYYCPWSLAGLFQRCGFSVVEVTESFSGQFVSLVARTAQGPESIPTRYSQRQQQAAFLAESFSDEYAQTVDYWDDKLQQLVQQGRETVVWGAGTKGVMFLNLVPAARHLRYACDVNPRKHGRFVAGGGQRICAPAELSEIGPDVVLVMNPCYEEEIRSDLARRGVRSEIVVI